MGTKTTRLDLLKPGENDYYNQQTEQADNWQKVDDYAVYTDRDKNAIWGGLDGGGLIEDPSVAKVVGKRYIGADGKAYICLVPSNINNSTNYAPCNAVDNLDKLQNLITIYSVDTWKVIRYPEGYKEFITCTKQAKNDKDIIAFPENFTELDSINIQLTEITGNAGAFTSVGILGVGDLTLNGFSVRLHRPNSMPQAPELMMIRIFGK